MEKLIVNGDTFIPFLTEEEIQKRIAELGSQISEDYKDKTPIFVGILNGAYMFISDLMKNFCGECEIDFLRLSSYGEEKVSSGQVKLLKDIGANLNNRHVIVVEDIVDSGLSVLYIKELLAKANPASVKIASLLIKPNSLKYDLKIDYIGFWIPDKFVIGYGLDLAQKYRNLRSIYALSE